MRFLAGLAVILLPGGLWAGLTKDPVRQENFNEFRDVMAVPVNGPPMMAEPAMPVFTEIIDLPSGEEVTVNRSLFETSIVLFELEEGDRLVVSVSGDANDGPPGYRSIIDLTVREPDGAEVAVSSVVFPTTDDTPAVDVTAEVAGEHSVELRGDFSPFDVDLTLARNPEAAADDAPDGEG